MTITDCDDGVGDSSRAKSCVKKLVNQDKVFALVTAWDWGTASMHDDLAQYKLPYVGSWAYSQTEWQDPWMFPAHMSMIHEAMSEAHWVKNVMKPKTYGLLCLASPEMQLACNEVIKVLEPTGAKMVKRVDAAVSETSMSPYVLAMRAANPDVIIHYTINPTTIIKFVAESAQQGYWPTKGIAGNHLAAEVLGKLFGKWPVNRYWTNTTYKMWGNGFMSTMDKYAPGNRGLNYHIVQSGYVGINIFAQAAKQVGPNLTADRLRAALANGAWNTDVDLGQTFMYNPGERSNNWRDDTAQGKEYMYKYTSTNTISNPDGSPSGFEADKDQFVIHTRK
jgi:ABC-type branched-subunit amino acid transport system substrate-binding protein